MDDLVQRLQRFEEYMKDERQDYPAELLHRTIDRIEQLEANERAWLATNEDLQRLYQQTAARIERVAITEAERDDALAILRDMHPKLAADIERKWKARRALYGGG